MPIYRGLNVAKALSDIDDSRQALKNLGLNREDFDLIAGLTSSEVGVGISDFHNMAGLTSDQKKELESLASAADATEIAFLKINDISTPLKFNFRLNNNKLAGGAIKYNYLDFSATPVGGNFVEKSADISTSRLSSWSPVGDPNPDDYILYGGDIKIVGDRLSYTKLSTTEAPIARTFRAEVATHVATANLNSGVSGDGLQSMYLMKGIPLEWEGVFEEISLKAAVTPIADAEGNIPITWRITNLQAPAGSYNSGDGSNNTASIGTGTLGNPTEYKITPPGYAKRKIEFFYDPAKVLRLEMTSANISKWTNVSLPNLNWLNLSFNDFPVMPEFRSDGTAAKQGFDGGAGLAPTLDRLYITANDLGRGNDALLGEGDRENTGNSSQQLNRLPLTLRYLIANGCFSDNADIDLTDYENLIYLDLSSNFTRELRRPQTATNSPATYNPKKRVFFSVETDTSWASSASSNQMYIQGHGFTTNGTPVRYDYHADSSGTMAEPISSLSANTTYYVRVINNNVIELYNAEGNATNTGSTTGRRSMSGEGGDGHGKLHSLIQWDTSTNKAYMASTTKGIDQYRIYNQGYSRLTPGAYNSKKLHLFYANSTENMATNSETPHYASTASIDGTVTAAQAKAKSSADMAIPKIEADTNFRYWYSAYNPHNIVDFSGNTSIYRYYQYRGNIDTRYEEAETTLDGKFTGCTSLTHIHVYNCYGTSGNFETSNLFQNLPNLQYVNTLVWGRGGMKGRITDNMFNGSPKVRDFTVGGDQMNQFTNDTFGTSGAGSVNTGKALFNANPNMNHFRVGNNRYGSGTLVQEEAGTHDFIWPTNDRMRTLYFYANNLRGTFPNVSNSFKFLSYLQLGYNAPWMRLRMAQSKQIYKISYNHLSNSGVDGSGHGGSNKDRLTTHDYKAIGWQVQSEADNIAAVGSVFGREVTGNPTSNDAFKLQHIPVAAGNPNNYIRNRYYRIMKLGNTDWNALTEGGNSSPYLGQKIEFKASKVGSISSSDAGTDPGEMMPYSTYASLRSLGLTGTFPTFSQTMTNLGGLFIYNNNFTGQCPKIDAPKLTRFYAHYNKFNGSIPDFSNCEKLKQIRLYNNQMSTFTAGFLTGAVRLETLDLRNNVLEASCLRELLIDLIENYTNRERSGVTVNLKGQSGANRLRESSKFDGSSGESSTAAKLDFLRQVAGWSILLDS